MAKVTEHFIKRRPSVEQFLFNNSPSQGLCQIMLALSVEYVGINTNSILILLPNQMKDVLNKSCFPNFPWRNKNCITSIFQISNESFRLYSSIAEVLRTLITLINKGV